MANWNGGNWLDDVVLPGLLTVLLVFMLMGGLTGFACFFFDWPRKWEGGANTADNHIGGSLKIELQQQPAAPVSK
jgi:hypothetical protein